MFTNFTCSSYLIIWHIKIQLNHWQWHNNQWKWKWNTQSEISLCHHSTSNTGFCICVQKKWNSTKLMNDQKNCQLSENVKHWTKSRGQSSSNRCQRTGVTKTTTKDWFGLLIKGGSSHKSPTAAQFVSLLSSTTTKCLVVSIKDTQGNLPTP